MTHMCSPTSSIHSLLCEECWSGPFSQESFSRLKQTLVNDENIIYKTTWSRVQQAADHGCGLCSLLIVNKENNKDEVTFRLGLNNDSGIPATPLHTQLLYTEIEGSEIEMEGYETEIDRESYFLYTSFDDPAAKEIVAREPVRDIQSDQSFSLTIKCLNDCIRNHPRCPKPNPNVHLPTRVIDCSDPLHPKLFSSQGMLNASYIALSYVWGSPQPNCTTTKNLEAYVAGIDINLVPKTIQDAIRVTNKFGFCYLWVDSFCIVQDSAEDKKKELAQMRRIFRDAHFTIIASRAKSAFAGFLHTCAPPVNTPTRLPFWCEDGRLGIVFTRPLPINLEGTNEPVDQRAWCLEERLLSARKLVYASDTVYYHCQSAVTAVGDSISPFRPAERLLDVMFLPDDKIGAHVSEWKLNDWRRLSLTWRLILRSYTNREVTKPKDKLAALAGVAEQYDRIWYPMNSDTTVIDGVGIGRNYLAGLWKHSLKRDLLWHRDQGMPSLRPSQYLAPSWSWASVSLQGEFNFMRGMEQQFDFELMDNPSQVKSCEILNCDVVLEDETLPHGRIKSGVLKMRSKMTPVVWTGGSYYSAKLGLFVVKGRLQDTPLLKVRAEAERDCSLLCVGWVSIDSIGELDKGLSLVFVMWNFNAKNARAIGLLLTDTGDGKFKRVGLWQAHVLEAMLSWYVMDGNDTTHILEIV